MNYVKLFINVNKKKNEKSISLNENSMETKLKEIFKEPIEDLFDKPEIIRNNFEQFLKYSEDYCNNITGKGIKIGSEHLDEVILMTANDDKSNEIEYHKKLFLWEYLGCFATVKGDDE